jgi:GNAT superfamily N-acetyltransferase
MNDQNPIHIRQATADDAPLLHHLIGALAAYDNKVNENESSVEAIRNELANEHGVLEALIAEYNGQPAGMATFIKSFATFANKRGIYLEDIYVIEELRHHGIGTAIMKFLANLAIERNYGRIAWTTMVWNTDAIDFWGHLGTRPSDEWTAFRENRKWLERTAHQP